MVKDCGIERFWGAMNSIMTEMANQWSNTCIGSSTYKLVRRPQAFLRFCGSPEKTSRENSIKLLYVNSHVYNSRCAVANVQLHVHAARPGACCYTTYSMIAKSVKRHIYLAPIWSNIWPVPQRIRPNCDACLQPLAPLFVPHAGNGSEECKVANNELSLVKSMFLKLR